MIKPEAERKANMIFYRGDQVGEIKGKTYITKRNKKQYFKIYRGFGISVSIIDLIKPFANSNIIEYKFDDGVTIDIPVQMADLISSDIISGEYVKDRNGKPDTQYLIKMDLPEKTRQKPQKDLDGFK